jgi:hypothetical protein
VAQTNKKGRSSMATKAPEAPEVKTTRPGAAKIRWDDTQMKSSYANVCNVSNTREEVVLAFGVNQAWNRSLPEVTIQLTDRVILNPYVAKSLAAVLVNVIRDYEARYGTLAAEPPPPTKQ